MMSEIKDYLKSLQHPRKSPRHLQREAEMKEELSKTYHVSGRLVIMSIHASIEYVETLGILSDDKVMQVGSAIRSSIPYILRSGKRCSVRYFISDVEFEGFDAIQEQFIKSLYGKVSAQDSLNVCEHWYSEITSDIIVTDENGFTVGNHDILKELSSSVGKYVYMEIAYAPKEVSDEG